MYLPIACKLLPIKQRFLTKTLLVMRLTSILLLTTCLQLSAKTKAQSITLSEDHASLEKVFKEIKEQTGYLFVYRDEWLQQTRKVHIQVKNATLQQVLEICFRQQPFTYTIIDKMVVLKQKTDLVPAIHPIDSLTPPPINITGKVINAKDEPLAGVAITVKGTKKGTVTESDGHYNISVDGKTSVLQFSHIGFATKEIATGEEQIINVELQIENKALDQIVIIGYGTQKKEDITSSVSVISSKALEDRPNVQFGDAIEGKAAGVQVIRPSGQPQAGFSIRIRGVSTVTAGSEPLYILDGVPITNTSEINPADIESFSILKDAASASIYGSSGANGVVLITTRRGKNQKPQVNLDVYTGYSSVWKHISALNSTQYQTLMTEMGLSLDWNKYTANTDWQKELFRKANAQNYQLSVTGGNDITKFYLSGSWVKNDGVVIGNTVNRTNFKLNLDHKISKKFNTGASISYNRWYDVDVPENSSNGSIMNAILGSPVIRIFDTAGKAYTTDPFKNDLDNPVGLATGTLHNWTNIRFNGSAYVEAVILPVLKFRSMFGVDQYHGVYNYYADPYKTVTGRGFNGQAEMATSDKQYWISENTLNFNKSIKEHSITALAGFIASKTIYTGSDIRTHNFANPAITTVNGGSVIDGATGTTTATSTSSFISRISYAYAEKYLVTASFRADASSVFGPQNRWGYFPSFSLGWRISKENFFRNITAVNDLKLRASWGKVGNDQIPPYSYLGTVAPSGTYVIGGKVVPGYLPQSLNNFSLNWETTKQTDIGLDMTALNSRILFTADYYYKKTIGLLLQVPVPASSGYTSALENIGDLENSGLEFQLTTRNLVGEFQWSSDFNISFNKNKILNIAGGTINDGPLSADRGNVNTSIAKAGLPLGSFFGYVADGVDKNTGNLIYEMEDKTLGLQTSDQRVIGNANPQFIYGFTNNFKYGQWSLNIFLQGVQGNDIFNATRIYTEGMWEARNQSSVVLNRWQSAGQITNIPRQDVSNPYIANGVLPPNYNSLVSSRFVENGSYLRLKSLTLRYDLSARLLNSLKIQRAKFYVTGENLLTFTKYSGFDPEVSAFSGSSAGSQSNNVAPGVDLGTYPQTRQIIFGLNLTF
jgi:TonB-linked SusC/RagA family outer membrane protein